MIGAIEDFTTEELRAELRRRRKAKWRHGHSDTLRSKASREYKSWVAMRQRCNNPNDTGYKNYGGRGIKVCERWNRFENFLADLGYRPFGHSLDRIDSNGDYEPSNCRWATKLEQNRNRRNVRRDIEYASFSI